MGLTCTNGDKAMVPPPLDREIESTKVPTLEGYLGNVAPLYRWRIWPQTWPAQIAPHVYLGNLHSHFFQG